MQMRIRSRKFSNKLNSLEEDANKLRVIFAVDKLNEGWDVLNLFDVVKLYETPSTAGNPPTTREIQLIGQRRKILSFSNYPRPRKIPEEIRPNRR